MAMPSRERVNTVLNHQQADRVPLDLGGCSVTGMHVSSVYLLRQALALDAPGTLVKVVEQVRIFCKDGGFVFNTIHNVQVSFPKDNLIALYTTFAERRYFPDWAMAISLI